MILVPLFDLKFLNACRRCSRNFKSAALAAVTKWMDEAGFTTLLKRSLVSSESGRGDVARTEMFSATAARMSAFNAFSSILSPSWKSMARLVLPSRLELKRPEGSSSAAPLAKVSFTTALYVSPVQMIPSCSHTGTPSIAFDGFLHFTSSTTSGSACLMRLRTRASVSPRQSPSSLILASISREGESSPFASFEPLFVFFMVVVAFFMVVVARPSLEYC